MPTVAKTKTAKVKTKSGYDFEYGYVDLATIDKYLEENNLAYDQFIEVMENKFTGGVIAQFIMTQRYKIKDDGTLEKWGEPMRGLPFDIPAGLDIQGIGSRTTYLRRYSVSMAFGLAPEDDDGQSAMPKEKPQAKATPAKTKAKAINATEAQLKKIKENADNAIVVNALAYYQKEIDKLTVKEASTIIARLNEEGV